MARDSFSLSGSLIAVSILAAACSRTIEPQEPVLPPAPAPEASAPPLEAGVTGATSAETARRIGDVRVVRFSGSFREGDLVLREEVVDLGAHTVTIDYTLDDGFDPTTLRVVHTRQSERVVEVQRQTGDEYVPAASEDFDRLLARTTFAPSRNRGETASKEETCLVGMDEYECSVQQYAVLVGDQEATLTVARAADQDVSGEVVAVDGTLLYRAQTLELRKGGELPANQEASVASK